MVIAMAAMGMVQAAFDQIISMIAMPHGWITAVCPMNMVLAMAPGALRDSASVRMFGVYLDNMPLNAVALLMFQMAAF